MPWEAEHHCILPAADDDRWACHWQREGLMDADIGTPMVQNPETL